MRILRTAFAGLLLLMLVSLSVMYRALPLRAISLPVLRKTTCGAAVSNTFGHSETTNCSSNLTRLRRSSSEYPTSASSRLSPISQASSKTVGNITSMSKAKTTSGTAIHKLNRTTAKLNSTKTPTTLGKLICIQFQGRLGNTLFQYASVLGLARKLHRIPVYLGNSLLKNTLQQPPPTANKEHKQRCQKAAVQMERGCCHFQKVFLNLDPQKDYSVGLFTYLQSWKYFEGLETELRQILKFKDSMQAKANKTLQELRKRCNQTLIGVHVRRGDYLNSGNVKLGYRTAPPDFFLRAMTYMRHSFGNVTFLVSVDNRTWFLQSVTSANDVIILKRQEAAVDMALLTSLDHVIISVGTYSWWVGFLNRGVTVFWKDFIEKDTQLGSAFDLHGTTYVYPGWVPI